MNMSGSQIFVQLLQLRNESGKKHYQRIKLAAQLLQDKEWVESPTGGGGDENKAIDRLELDCFGDIVGTIGLPEMLDVFTHIPNEKDWEKNKYNLKKMWADWKSKQPGKASKKPTPSNGQQVNAPIPMAGEFFNLSTANQHREYQKITRLMESDTKKITRLEAENAALKVENKQLKEENTKLNKVFRNYFVEKAAV